MKPPSVSRSSGIRSVRRSRSTMGPVGRSSPTGSGSRRYTRIASENVGTVARHRPITISSRSMPRAILRVAAPTNRSRSPSRRMGMGAPGATPCPLRRSRPPTAPPDRSGSPPGCAGMVSGAGLGRCGSGSVAAGWECSESAGWACSEGACPLLAQGAAVPGSAGASPMRA